jgi:DNA-binding MarR family transcriptional regulator
MMEMLSPLAEPRMAYVEPARPLRTRFQPEHWMLCAARRSYTGRRERERLFGGALFADPVWDILLYLFIAAGEGRHVSVSEVCSAASVPATTALRNIAHMTDRKLLIRCANPEDRRSSHLKLSAAALEKMALCFVAGLRARTEPDLDGVAANDRASAASNFFMP